MAKPTTTDKHDALYELWHLYLLMAAWGTEHWREVDKKSAKAFADLVRDRALFAYVEDCKRIPARFGLDIPDDWLLPLYASRLTVDGPPLGESERAELGRIMTAIYPMLVKLGGSATAPRRTTEDYRRLVEALAAGAGEGSDTHDPLDKLIPLSTVARDIIGGKCRTETITRRLETAERPTRKWQKTNKNAATVGDIIAAFSDAPDARAIERALLKWAETH